MAKLKITFTHEHPGEKFTDGQITEWLSHRLGASPTISADNPLARTKLSAAGKIEIKSAEQPAKKGDQTSPA